MMTLKDPLRGIARTLGRSIVGRTPSHKVSVLCYHSVHPRTSFATRPSLFEEHLRWLRDHCDVISFKAALEHSTGRLDSRPAVAVTFDDGFADNYEHAVPLLHRYGMTATFFLTTGLLDREPDVLTLFQKVRGVGYEEIRPLTWSQVRQMRKAGMDLGAHTRSHPNLARIGRVTALEELRRSKTTIEDRIGVPIDMMAYPFGRPGRDFTLATMALAGEAGYATAGSAVGRTVFARCSPLAIPRFLVAQDTVAVLDEKLAGVWDLLAGWQGSWLLTGFTGHLKRPAAP